jgi:hypothetical protein
MATISFNQWGFGLDLRKGASTADANRLRVLKNAYVTDGKTVRKRPGLKHVETLTPGTVGLFAGLGRLNTFQTSNTATVVHPGQVLNHVLTPESAPEPPLLNVSYCDTFNGKLYVVAWHYSIPFAVYRHHYLDGSPDTRILDVNCPYGIFAMTATKAASKMWAGDEDVVRFSATNNPRDWTTADDAGFLPVGIQASGSSDVQALGSFQNRLVTFFTDSSQIWQVDPDPANHQFLDQLDIGTKRPYAHQNMSGDVFFLSPGGVRTITRQASTESLVDSDVGSPIDYELLRNTFIDVSKARAQYYRGAGQYWLYQGAKAVVFTFSRSSKISAWSVYEFPFSLDWIDELDGELYVRSGDEVYQLDRETWTDNGTPYEVLIETPFVDFKSPGVDKMIYALDAVLTGTGEISHRFDPRQPQLLTSPPVTITGDTQPGTLYPVELVTTNLATRVRNFDDKEFELHSFSYKFEVLA